ncbi:MAG: tannase/feruloyl esterase family alpha/beta hydrolase [Sphaerotilus natans subsp. sulfidivorans]|nr:tannase/feruloyl esterase family alpha/beta hydrolase [Sphaerotilus sulfidivorans]
MKTPLASWTKPAAARPRALLPVMLAILALTGCGSDEDDTATTPTALPQLSAAQAGTLSGDCASLAAKLNSLSNISVTAVNTIAAGALKVGGQDIAEHCQVSALTESRTSAVDGQNYAIRFEMRLPKTWNGRFFHQGNGGLDGSVLAATGASGGGPLTHALAQGFAVLSSDAGHTSAQNPAFGIDPQARLNYGYQAAAKLTPIARAIILAAYDRQADRAYFGGCSNGGRHAMVAASRMPESYDGYLVGAPGFNLPKAAVANIYKGQRYAMVASSPTTDLSTAITAAERKVVADAVLAKCDALDGATDGLVQDTDACQTAFQWERDVPGCSGNTRDGTCLTAAQKTAIAPIFSGAVDSSGKAFYARFPFDPGYAGSGIPSWAFTAPSQRDAVAIAFTFKTPPDSPVGFNGVTFALNANIDTLLQQIEATSATYAESSMSFMTPPSPTDLSKLKNRGAKMLVYHGVSDPIFSVEDTTTWYKALAAANGGDASNFARLFRVPGMGHCSGGPATDQFDAVSALVKWVEQGQAPDSLIAKARGTGNAGGVNADVPSSWAVDRTRPLCAWPKVARYKGTGSLDDASSFECRS